MGLRQSRKPLGQGRCRFLPDFFCQTAILSARLRAIILSPSYSMNCGQITAFVISPKGAAPNPCRHFYRPILAIDRPNRALHAGSCGPVERGQRTRRHRFGRRRKAATGRASKSGRALTARRFWRIIFFQLRQDMARPPSRGRQAGQFGDMNAVRAVGRAAPTSCKISIARHARALSSRHWRARQARPRAPSIRDNGWQIGAAANHIMQIFNRRPSQRQAVKRRRAAPISSKITKARGPAPFNMAAFRPFRP